ncbi:helix-turn-helix domain-containing protein [Natrononativus amylolyticus]|uniref:helix-turn-helix domain-containing protein n=1 Tax=Natrononativus amylolyticus TaxID=2963434 RepID=UPI0020CCA685|nr:helix-turn-helix domain-containing protein [Natrononativus amylolyticus]
MSAHSIHHDTEVDPDDDPTALLAEIRLTHPQLALQASLRGCPNVVVTPDYESTDQATSTETVFFTARGPEDQLTAFEDALDDDPTVTNTDRVGVYSDRCVYRTELTDEVLHFMPLTVRTLGRVLNRECDIEGWTLSLRFPGREELLEFNRLCTDAGISVHVLALLETNTGTEDDVLGLTPKQQQLLAKAYESGYFETPRRVSQLELAEEADVSKSAISQRLRRSIGALCHSTLPNVTLPEESSR